MIELLVFAVALFVAVLISELADRSVLSTAVLFLVAGFVAGHGLLNLIPLNPEDAIVQQISQLALFSVLFTDGMRVSLHDLISAWKLPGRALIFGLPLTALGTALLMHYLAGLAWLEALLIGAILSPTDPVFAAAIIGRKEIPYRLRHLLNVESGVNDGLALPLVIVLIALLTGRAPELPLMAGELAAGVALGIALPLVACQIEQSRYFRIAKTHEPLFAVAVGLLVLTIASLTHVNLFLAAFSAGITLATLRPALRDEFRHFGELVTELLKLAALLLFGALMSPKFLSEVPLSGYVAAVLILLLVRPAAIEISLIGSGLTWQERLTAGWFGPKGFASAIYGLLLFTFHVPNGEPLFHLVAIVIAASILAHSSSDVPLARWFHRCEEKDAAKNRA